MARVWWASARLLCTPGRHLTLQQHDASCWAACRQRLAHPKASPLGASKGLPPHGSAGHITPVQGNMDKAAAVLGMRVLLHSHAAAGRASWTSLPTTGPAQGAAARGACIRLLKRSARLAVACLVHLKAQRTESPATCRQCWQHHPAWPCCWPACTAGCVCLTWGSLVFEHSLPAMSLS